MLFDVAVVVAHHREWIVRRDPLPPISLTRVDAPALRLLVKGVSVGRRRGRPQGNALALQTSVWELVRSPEHLADGLDRVAKRKEPLYLAALLQCRLQGLHRLIQPE